MKTMKQVLGILVAFAVAFSLVPAGSCAYAETIRSAAADADISVVGARVGYVEPGTQHYVFDPQETGAFLGKRGDTVQLLPIVVWSTGSAEYVADAGVSVSWESEDPSIVAVDVNGVARAKRCGATNVTMRLPSSWGGASASIAVAVGVWDGPSLENLEVFVDGLSFVSSGVYELPSSMEVGDTVQLKATATYSDGTVLRTWKDQEIPGLEWWVDYPLPMSLLFARNVGLACKCRHRACSKRLFPKGSLFVPWLKSRAWICKTWFATTLLFPDAGSSPMRSND